jgi:hypothetical protein
MSAPAPAPPPARLSRETELLLATASSAPPRPAELHRELDWGRLALVAQQEGATSALWQWMRQASGGAVRPDVAEQWQKRAMVSAFQSLHLERVLHEALDVLASRRIDVMLLKGSALAYTAYGSFAERPMGDLDVLVRAGQARDAWLLLQERGWRWPDRESPLERYANHQHLPPLAGASGGEAVLEVHAALLPGGHPFRWPIEDLWAEAREVSVGGRRFLVPYPVHQLLHVCLHFAWSHEMRWGSWRMLRDVGALMRRGGISWDRFVELSRDAGAATCCYWTLRLARNLTGAGVPDEVLQALRPPRPEFVLKRLEAHYMRQLFPGDGACPSALLSGALWELGIAPRWSRHGRARPWHVSEQWTAALSTPVTKTGWWARVRERARHLARAVRYLARITMTRASPPASASPTTRSAP